MVLHGSEAFVNLTNVYAGGTMIVSGGTAWATIGSGGVITTLNGTMSRTLIAGNGSFCLSGGVASDTVVGVSGRMYVRDGTALGLTAGGSRAQVTVSGGRVYDAHVGHADPPDAKLSAVIVVSGGTLFDPLVYAGGTMTQSGGVVSNVTVMSGGKLKQNGGELRDVHINSGGTMDLASCTASRVFARGGSAVVLNGGVLLGGSTYYDGVIEVRAGGLARSLNVFSGAVNAVNGGEASYLNVAAAGVVNVSSGANGKGVVSEVTIGPEGTLNVSRGAVASTVVISGFDVDVNVYGSLCSASAFYLGGVGDSGTFRVLAGGTAVSTVLAEAGSMTVMDGGLALDTKLLAYYTPKDAPHADGAYARLEVSSGGTAGNTVIWGDNYELTVHAGGTATGTVVSSNGHVEVRGGSAIGTIVRYGGQMNVRSAGVVSGGEISGGLIGISGNAYASGVSVMGYGFGERGLLTVATGGCADETQVRTSGFLAVGTSGLATRTIVSHGTAGVSNGGELKSTTLVNGKLLVSSGGTANTTDVAASVYVYVYDSGVLSSASFASDGKLTVSSGGTATSLVASAGASMALVVAPNTLVQGTSAGSAFQISAASASGLGVDVGCALTVENGGTAVGIKENGGCVEVDAGGIATFSANSFGNVELALWQSATVHGGTTATQVTVGPSAKMAVYSGGSARQIVENGGEVFIENGADVTFVSNSFADIDIYDSTTVHSGVTATSATVRKDGKMTVFDGGSACFATVSKGGTMTISSGGMLCGLQVVDGAAVFAVNAAEIRFDLTNRTTADPALVNDFSQIIGTPDCTITVKVNQANGTYVLAEGASTFDRTVTIRNTAGTSSSLATGGNATLNGKLYALTRTGGELQLTVSGDAVGNTAGDLNADGRADVIMSITQKNHGAEGATGAWLIQSDQTAAWGDLSQRNPGWEIFGTGITAAGKATNDVYVKSADNVIGAWVTDNSGHVTGWETVSQFDDATQILGLGDFNGNGQTDLLLRNVNGAVGCFFTGGGKTGWNYFQSLGDEWKITAVGDLNGDGRDDVVLKHDAGFAGSWLTQSDGTRVWANLDTLPAGFAIVGCGDFDGDGVDDVLLQKGTYYGAWLAQNGSVKSWFGLGDLGNVTVEQIADFDGDGKDDLRIRTAAGDLGAQLVRAADTLEWHYYGSVGNEWSTSLAAI